MEEKGSLIQLTESNRSYHSIDPELNGAINGDVINSGQHCHGNVSEKRLDTKARRTLIIASLLCLVFMVGEALGGILGNSLAILSDAAHMLTDFASFMISLLALYLGSRPATKKLSFGWYRAEIIGALVSVLFIWVVTGILVYVAILRIVEEDYEIDATIMMITAACGVVVNLVMGLTLHQHAHGHGHSHSSGEHSHSSGEHSHGDSHSVENCIEESGATPKVKHKTNVNVRAAFIHVLGDLIQSVGVLIASFIIFYKPTWKIADPICTFVFSAFVLVTTITILRDILRVLMEGTPKGISFSDVKMSFYAIQGVKEVHNLRVWSLTISKTALSAHIAVEKGIDPHAVLKQAAAMVQRKYGITESTLQIEEFVSEMLDCKECQDPKD
ncbi:proton-coupled zinc antiporter SLC30A2-like [Liolophura sinensis]|uniref:proton-coupled zinc antiporter SLC30A2-like n=1 Tax=Liolophura sinensis TaxID=3198878 RepID=UPI0031583DC5